MRFSSSHSALILCFAAALAVVLSMGCSPTLYGPEDTTDDVVPDPGPGGGDDVGQGDDVTPPEPEEEPPAEVCTALADQPVILDCDIASGYEVDSWRADQVEGIALHMAAVYQTRSDHSYDNHPMGAAHVSFELPGANALVLSAYEPTTWTVELTDTARLERIVAIGYHEQVVLAPAGIPVEIHSFEILDSPLWACGYSLPYNGGGCDTDELIGNAEVITGLSLSSFDGCYDATSFRFASSQPAECADE